MSKTVLADNALVESIQNGGLERLKALEKIYKTPGLRDRIVNYVTYYGGKKEDGEDVFVEAVIIVDKNIRFNKFKGESSISTYTYGVAKLYWANKKRLVKRDNLDINDFSKDLSDYQNPELIFINSEIKTKLSKILDLLSDKCSSILKMWSNSVKYSEIAKELNVENTSQLRKMKYDCQRKLKEALIRNPELIPNYYDGGK
jgi:RNA polymerase sigma factor (sigma-70 family)